MEQCLEGLWDTVCIPYLDDILVFSPTFEMHVDHVKQVLQRLRESGIELKPRKCELFKKGVKYLGYVVSGQGYQTGNSNVRVIEALKDFHPKTVGDVRHILGLAYPKYDMPFILHTDASNSGLRAVLYQRQEGKMRAISYASRTLTPSERNCNFHSGKLEFLALKWAVCDEFRDILHHAPEFTVYADNKPLTYIMSTAKLNATGHRWVSELSQFYIHIKRRPGEVNVDADFLSRMQVNIGEYIPKCTKEVQSDFFQATVNACSCSKNHEVVWVSALSGNTSNFDLQENEMLGPQSHQSFSSKDIREPQEKDEVITPVVKYKSSSYAPSSEEKHRLSHQSKVLLRDWISSILTMKVF